MLVGSLQVLTEWWFWVLLPVALPLFFALDRLLASYNKRYWHERGQNPPPHRNSYLDAGRFVILAGGAGVVSVIELVQGEFLWTASLAGLTAVFAWLAVRQARRNVI